MVVTTYFKVIELYRSKRKRIPRKLYLQLDNGENKGNTLFAYLACLVENKTFEEVEVAFLPPGEFFFEHLYLLRCSVPHTSKNLVAPAESQFTNFLRLFFLEGVLFFVILIALDTVLHFYISGHTHEDIDQMFSRLGLWIKDNDVYTPEQMMRGCAQHFKADGFTESVCHYELLEMNYDFVKVLFPPDDKNKFFHSMKGYGTKRGSKEHGEYKGLRAGCYRLFIPKDDCEENTEHIVCLQYKEWATDDHWLPYEDTVRPYPSTLLPRPLDSMTPRKQPSMRLCAVGFRGQDP